MLGIIRNKNISWVDALSYIPRHLLEVCTLSLLSTSNYKIIRAFDGLFNSSANRHYCCCLFWVLTYGLASTVLGMKCSLRKTATFV